MHAYMTVQSWKKNNNQETAEAVDGPIFFQQKQQQRILADISQEIKYMYDTSVFVNPKFHGNLTLKLKKIETRHFGLSKTNGSDTGSNLRQTFSLSNEHRTVSIKKNP